MLKNLIYYLRKINDEMYAFSMSSSSWFEVKMPYEIKKDYGNGYIRQFNNNKSSYFLRNGEIRIYLEDFEYEKYVPSAQNTIMVHILNLRKKIEDDHTNPVFLKTIWGKGYQFD